MPECYLGEIRMFAGDYAPKEGWALCDGKLLSVSGNEALFSLLGTTYGGDGCTTFGVPDLRGRLPIHSSPAYALGSQGGSETVSLTEAQLPKHTHVPNAVKNAGDVQSPVNALWASTPNYSDKTDSSGKDFPFKNMNTDAVSKTGDNQEHDNMMPSVAISFIIALRGEYPFPE